HVPVLLCHVSLLFFFMSRPPPPSPLFPYTTLFRSHDDQQAGRAHQLPQRSADAVRVGARLCQSRRREGFCRLEIPEHRQEFPVGDRKSTRLNSSHVKISYAVFCLKKKKEQRRKHER